MALEVSLEAFSPSQGQKISSKVFPLLGTPLPRKTPPSDLESALLRDGVIAPREAPFASKMKGSSKRKSVKVGSPTSDSSIDPNGATKFGSDCCGASGADDTGTDVGAWPWFEPFALFWPLKEFGCLGVMGVDGVGVGGSASEGVAAALRVAVDPFFVGR